MKEETFADVVRNSRVTQGLRLREVAEAVGVSIPYISDIENGRRNAPDLPKLIRLARVLNLDRGKLMRLSLTDRQSIELPVGSSAQQTDFAVALARSWGQLSPEQEEDIMKILRQVAPEPEE